MKHKIGFFRNHWHIYDLYWYLLLNIRYENNRDYG
jgi:hypothetical protein